MGLPSPSSFSPSASLRMTCSGVCRRCFIGACPPCPNLGASDSHKSWISSRGPGQSHVWIRCERWFPFHTPTVWGTYGLPRSPVCVYQEVLPDVTTGVERKRPPDVV